MKNYPALLLLLLFCSSCSKQKTGAEWGLEIQSQTSVNIEESATSNGFIQIIKDGAEKELELGNLNFPSSYVYRFSADEILEIKVGPTNFVHPVYFKLVRFENLHEIDWPEEAHKLETKRFFYGRADNLIEGFSVKEPFESERTEWELTDTDINYGEQDFFTQSQIRKILQSIEPNLKSTEFEGMTQTSLESYNTKVRNYTIEAANVGAEIAVRSRVGDVRIESMDIKVIFPMGEFETYKENIVLFTERFVMGISKALIKNSAAEEWLVKDIFKPLDSSRSGRTVEAGEYLFTSYRINWDYVEPVEYVALKVERKQNP